jgi:hypothetical protein
VADGAREEAAGAAGGVEHTSPGFGSMTLAMNEVTARGV